MNENNFIEKLQEVLKKGTINDVKNIIMNPPGRQPDKNLLILSKWFNNLKEEDKDHINKIIELSVDSSIFGFLCILDSVRAIEDDFEKGSFELYYKKGDQKVLLNDESNDYLHDLYNSIS
jgi:hypothetical protein